MDMKMDKDMDRDMDSYKDIPVLAKTLFQRFRCLISDMDKKLIQYLT